jgi:hypothetical protein
VLEALEASIAAHPASGRREQGRSGAAGVPAKARRAHDSSPAPVAGTAGAATVTPIRRHEGATVLQFTPRHRTSPYPTDAA